MPYGGVCLLKGMPYEGFDSRLDCTISTDHASHPKENYFFIRLKSKEDLIFIGHLGCVLLQYLQSIILLRSTMAN